MQQENGGESSVSSEVGPEVVRGRGFVQDSMAENGTRRWVIKNGYPQALEESSKKQLLLGVKNSVEFDFYNSLL